MCLLCLCMLTYVSRLDKSVLGVFLGLSTLRQSLSWGSWTDWPVSSRDLLVSTHRPLQVGLQIHATAPWFNRPWVLGIQTQALKHFTNCLAILKWACAPSCGTVGFLFLMQRVPCLTLRDLNWAQHSNTQNSTAPREKWNLRIYFDFKKCWPRGIWIFAKLLLYNVLKAEFCLI